jgi:hypothetical protein
MEGNKSMYYSRKGIRACTKVLHVCACVLECAGGLASASSRACAPSFIVACDVILAACNVRYHLRDKLSISFVEEIAAR